jgi:antitoxin HigA-1
MMHNPAHPGHTLRNHVLPAVGLSVIKAATQLDVSRVSLSRMLNGRSGISSDMPASIEA